MQAHPSGQRFFRSAAAERLTDNPSQAQPTGEYIFNYVITNSYMEYRPLLFKRMGANGDAEQREPTGRVITFANAY
jgi:hypothetical protein